MNAPVCTVIRDFKTKTKYYGPLVSVKGTCKSSAGLIYKNMLIVCDTIQKLQ